MIFRRFLAVVVAFALPQSVQPHSARIRHWETHTFLIPAPPPPSCETLNADTVTVPCNLLLRVRRTSKSDFTLPKAVVACALLISDVVANQETSSVGRDSVVALENVSKGEYVGRLQLAPGRR